MNNKDFMDIIESYSLDKLKIAQIYRDTTFTYKELKEKSDAFACYLLEQFGEDKSPIVVYGHKQHEMLICFFACTKSGHPYIPVDITFPVERVNDIIENSGAKILIKVSPLEMTVPCEIIEAQSLNEIYQRFLGMVPDKKYRVQDNDAYYILYTSGSTGKPKGVEITKGCLINFIDWFEKYCNLTVQNQIFMNQVSYSFDVSVISVYIGLLKGATLFVVDKDMIADFKDLFLNFKNSDMAMWISTPSFVEMCLVDSSFNKNLLPNMEKMFFAGEVLANSVVDRLFDRFDEVTIINGYGPTEATVLATAVEIDRTMSKEQSPLPIGYPLENGKVIIVDENNNEVSNGIKGELVIIGDSVSPGYYRNKELSNKVFGTMVLDGVVKRTYKTGDLAYIENGLVYYCGRKDFQVKLNGYRIELEDIENNLRKIDPINSAVVLPVTRNGKISHLIGFVTLNSAINESEFKMSTQIKEQLGKLVPSYMVPRQIRIKESFPTNTNGKIDRKVLMEELC